MSKIWFVTGSSRGFGRRFVEAALERGDKVVATARQAHLQRTVRTMHRSAFEGTMPKVGRHTVDDRADPRRLAAASTFTHGNR